MKKKTFYPIRLLALLTLGVLAHAQAATPMLTVKNFEQSAFCKRYTCKALGRKWSTIDNKSGWFVYSYQTPFLKLQVVSVGDQGNKAQQIAGINFDYSADSSASSLKPALTLAGFLYRGKIEDKISTLLSECKQGTAENGHFVGTIGIGRNKVSCVGMGSQLTGNEDNLGVLFNFQYNPE